MAIIIYFDGIQPPDKCKDCQWLEREIDASRGKCELMSRTYGKTYIVNTFTSHRDIFCPFYEIDQKHGRLIDENELIDFYEDFPFGEYDVHFSISDIINNLDNIDSVLPEGGKGGVK